MPLDTAPVTHADLKEMAADVKEIKDALTGTTKGTEGLIHRVATLESESRLRGRILWVIVCLVAALIVNNGYTSFLRAITPPVAIATTTTNTTTTNNAPAQK